MTTKEEIEQIEKDDTFRFESDGETKRCPACGRDEHSFHTIACGEEGWTIECKCGELISED